jgi:hypothetical protein
MSWRSQLREIQRERQVLLRRDLRLRTDLKWQLAYASMLILVAGRLVSLVRRLGGPRRRRGHGR